MRQFTCWPRPIAHWLHVLRPMCRQRHQRVFCWWIVCQAMDQDKATITGLARSAPRPMAAWHVRRVLTATSWQARILLWWLADQALAVLPPPEDGGGSLVVDSRLKRHPGQQQPLAQKGGLNEDAPDLFGLHIVVVRRQWGNDRLPVDVELVRRKAHPQHRSENALVRGMLVRFRRPPWGEILVVVADAAFASMATRTWSRPRGDFFVIAFARTWRLAHAQSLNALVPHWPKKPARRGWVPLEEPGRRRTSGTSTTQARGRHVGDATLVWSKQRRNEGPHHTTILVTNLPEVTARQVVEGYRRRWSVELLMKELQGATGLGQHQVTKDPQRVERAVAIFVMAELLRVKFRARDLPEKGPWSAVARKRNVTWQIAQASLERSVEPRLRKGLQQRKAA
jgi:hypothetical protein